MKLKLVLLELSISMALFSQQVDSVLVRGQLITKDKNPLPNAIIRISNSDKEVVSDIFGQFELWSPIEGILEFSCISEPYRISLSSIGLPEENELIKFQFDLKQPDSNYKPKKLKGRKVRINKITQGRITDIILAYYTSNFEHITQKHFKYHQNQNHKIIFMINGQIMDENFTINNLDYSSFKQVAIIRIIDSYDKIIFMISTNEKSK